MIYYLHQNSSAITCMQHDIASNKENCIIRMLIISGQYQSVSDAEQNSILYSTIRNLIIQALYILTNSIEHQNTFRDPCIYTL